MRPTKLAAGGEWAGWWLAVGAWAVCGTPRKTFKNDPISCKLRHSGTNSMTFSKAISLRHREGGGGGHSRI